MTAHYHVRPAADRDMDDQAAYLAQEAEDLETALQLLRCFASVIFGKLADMPGGLVSDRLRPIAA